MTKEERNPTIGDLGRNTPVFTISAKKIIRYIAKEKKETDQQRGCSTGDVLERVKKLQKNKILN